MAQWVTDLSSVAQVTAEVGWISGPMQWVKRSGIPTAVAQIQFLAQNFHVPGHQKKTNGGNLVV